MSLEHMLRDEQEAWRFLLEAAQREGEFGMEHQAFYEAEMSGDNWFVQHPEVMEFIMKHERGGPGRPCPYCGRMPCICGNVALNSWRDEVVYIAQATSEVTQAHSDYQPFCSDWNCPCHEDRDNINALTEQVEAGLLTTVEANLIMRGATI